MNAVREGMPLSPREEQLLNLMAKGMKHTDIAVEWGIQARTLNKVLEHIKIKKGAKTTWQLMYMWGFHQGPQRIYF